MKCWSRIDKTGDEFEKSSDSVNQNDMDRSVNHKKRLFLPLFVVAILIIVSTVHIVAINAAASDEDERIFNLGLANAVQNPNPYVGVMDEEYIYYSMVYDYLTFPNEDGIATPNLAKEWWYMDGVTAAATGTDFSTFSHNSTPGDWPLGSIWEYNITPDTYWNDGTPFTAYDVEYTFNVQIGSNFMTFWAYQPVTRWVDHAEAMGEDKLRIFFVHYEDQRPFSIGWGYSLSVPLVPRHIFEDEPPTYLAFDWDGIPSIGTGPFMGKDDMKDELLSGEILTLVKNPYYDFMEDGVRKGLGGYFNRTVEVEKLLMIFFAEETTLSLAVQQGTVDAAQIQAITYMEWKDDPGALPDRLNYLSMLSGTVYSKQIVFNAYADAAGDLNPLRLDPAVHRASMLATNKSLLIDIIYKGLAVEGVGLISPVWPEWWWEPGDELSTFNITDGDGDVIFNYSKPMKDVMGYDLALANEILNESGYTDWSGGSFGNGHRIAGPLVGERMEYLFGFDPAATVDRTLEFEIIMYNEVFEDRQIAQFLITEWKKIGISLEQEPLDMAQRNSIVYSYYWNFMITYWSADVDPNYILYIPTSHALWGWNEFGTDSETYDYLYEQQATIIDYDERKYWIDRCLEWQYLSGSLNTICYPKVCYAYNDDKWTNWGNWSAHPNLAIDMFWGEPPLYYHITWAGPEEAEDGGLDIMSILMAAGVLAAILIAVVAMIIRKKKIQKLEESDEESEAEMEMKEDSRE